MTTRYNWKPVIGSLLKTLQDHGFTLVSVESGLSSDSELLLHGLTPRQARQQAKAEIAETDESHLYLSHPAIDKKLWVFVVLGNEPHETAADYSLHNLLEKAIEDFEQKWKDRKCPTY